MTIDVETAARAKADAVCDELGIRRGCNCADRSGDCAWCRAYYAASEPPKPTPEEVAREERLERGKKARAMIGYLKEGQARGANPWVRIVAQPINIMTGSPSPVPVVAGQVCVLTGTFGEDYCIVRCPGRDCDVSVSGNNVLPLSTHDAADVMFEQLGHRAEAPV